MIPWNPIHRYAGMTSLFDSLDEQPRERTHLHHRVPQEAREVLLHALLHLGAQHAVERQRPQTSQLDLLRSVDRERVGQLRLAFDANE